jgi:hypothetical protein
MAVTNRWAVRDSAQATFYSLTTLKPMVTLRTLRTSGVETSGETVYARGGSGHSKLVGFSSNREARLNLEDAIFDNDALAMLTGNDIAEGAKEIHYNESLTVASNAVTLTKTPNSSGMLALYEVNTDGTNSDEILAATPATPASGYYYISGKNITLNSGEFADDTILRAYYYVNTASDAKTVKVTSDMFGGSFKVVLDCIIRDEYTKSDYAGQIIVPNAKFEDNFSFSFASDGDPAVLTLPLEVLKSPTSTDMWYMVIYSEDDIT